MSESLKQLRDRFPEASILSDILMLHEQQYVVKVTIKIPPAIAISGLSSDANLEIAEDKARRRAIEALGLGTRELTFATQIAPATVTPASQLREGSNELEESSLSTDSPTPVASSQRNHPTATPVKHASSVSDTAAQSQTTSTASSSTEFASTSVDAAKVPTHNDLIQPERGSSMVSQPTAAAAILPVAKHSESTEIPATALPAPINLSDVIAQTDIELRRLNWSTETGRDYLEQTYNKRSRHELSEEELIQFLCYLEGLPSPEAMA